jgi:hypothetical protein
LAVGKKLKEMSMPDPMEGSLVTRTVVYLDQAGRSRKQARR